MRAYFEAFWGILLEISPFVILGMLAAGILHETMARFQRLRRFALKRNLWSLSFFNLSGFTLPICSCGVIPLAVGLRRQGVPLGNLLSFVFSAPATSIAAVILSIAVLGPDFALFYALGAILCGYAVGSLFYLIEGNRPQKTCRESVLLCEDEEDGFANRSFVLRALRWGTLTYGSRIAFDLLVGLALAALLVSTYSVQALGDWMADLAYWQAAILMILIAIPLYVCSLPGIIVAGTLVLGGVTPALIWIFLMAGPVTNLGDINVLRRNLGWRTTSLYIGLVVAVTFLWGWVINQNLQWPDIWVHVREYFATQVGLAGWEGDIQGALAESSWLGMPRELHYVSAWLMLLLTLNGAWLALKVLWANPCLHCKHFQQDLRLTPAICTQPCWKRRLVRSLKGGRTPVLGGGVARSAVKVQTRRISEEPV